MGDSATAKKLTRSDASFARRYGLAFASVAGALLLDLLFHHFKLEFPESTLDSKSKQLKSKKHKFISE